MSIIITLTDTLAARLQRTAQAQHRSLEEMALALLSDALEHSDVLSVTPEEVVAMIKATAPNPANVRLATDSLAKVLQRAPSDPNFNLETWNREWATAEAELKAITQANTVSEGRG